MKVQYKEKSSDDVKKNSKLLFITDTYTDLIKELKKDYAKVVVVAMEEEVQSRLQKENMTYKTLDEYIDEKTREKTFEDTILWMQAWSNKIIKDGKTFKEMVAYGNTSLWWSGAAATLYYDKVRDIIRYIDAILLMLNVEEPAEIVVMSNDKLFKKVISIIGATANISTSILEGPDKSCKKSAIFMRYYNLIRYTKWAWRILLIIAISKMKALSNKFRIGKTEQNKKNILILSISSNIVDVFNIAKGEIEKNDFIIASLVEKLKKDERYNVTVVEHHHTDKLDILSEKKLLHKPFESYVTPKSVLKVFKMLIAYRKLWKDLKTDKRVIDSLNYKNIPLYDLLEDELSYLFSKTLVGVIGFFEVMKRVIDVEEPDIIVASCEYSSYARSAVVEAKSRRIPTIGIQHGIMGQYHFDYRHAAHEISNDSTLCPNHCPIPDKTVVYGTYHKDFLTRICGYPEDSVVVTGQPRYDVLCHADKIYSKEKFLEKYKINPDHKIVLWTTQWGFSDAENISNLKAIFKTMEDMKNITLIVKQHPREEERETEMIEKHLNNYRINAIVTPKISDTFEQLFVCDLMITRHSTTAMEAVALNKPVIILNLSGEPDPVEYVREGVALGVYKEDDLKPAIEKLLKDDSELAKNRKRYIEKYLYKIDGKATERVIKLIEEMINEKQKRDEI